MKFSTKYLKETLDLPDSAVVDTITDTSRWSVHHEIIFKDNGKFYKTHYSHGATEYQDESPWEYEEEVECKEVQQVEKLVKVWEEV